MRYPDDVPTLTDGSVTLRAHRPDDRDAIYEQCQDPASQRFTTIPVPYAMQDAEDFLSGRAVCWETRTSFPFAIEAAQGVGPSRFAGSIGLSMRGPGVAEVGFGSHPAARGHGITSAAVRLILDWGFEALDLQTVIWRCLAGNLASWRVAWRTGFRFDGTTTATMPRRGEVCDGWTAVLRRADDRSAKHRWLDVPTLSDGHTTVRPMKPEDESRYLETVLDRQTQLWLSEIPFPGTPQAYQEHLRDAGLWPSLGQSIFWAVADAQTDEYVGGCGLFGFEGLDHKSVEAGYRSHPESRGKGHTSRALRLLAEHAFTAEGDGGYGIERLSLSIGDGNLGSIGVARACGFTETGRDRHCYLLSDGRVVDLLRFDLLVDEWRASRGGAAD